MNMLFGVNSQLLQLQNPYCHRMPVQGEQNNTQPIKALMVSRFFRPKLFSRCHWQVSLRTKGITTPGRQTRRNSVVSVSVSLKKHQLLSDSG
jgi:hypothetical protein